MTIAVDMGRKATKTNKQTNISSILSCEDVAKSDAETDKSVSVLRHDA